MRAIEATQYAQLHEAGSETEIWSNDWAIVMDQWIAIIDSYNERAAVL
jgi:hypothetical protein